jgi:hypothetical protein
MNREQKIEAVDTAAAEFDNLMESVEHVYHLQHRMYIVKCGLFYVRHSNGETKLLVGNKVMSANRYKTHGAAQVAAWVLDDPDAIVVELADALEREVGRARKHLETACAAEVTE